MGDIIIALQSTPVPAILVAGGILFLFIAIGGRFGANIATDKVKQGYAAIVGILFLFAGIALYIVPAIMPSPTPTVVAAVTPDTSTATPILLTNTPVPPADTFRLESPTDTPVIEPIDTPIPTTSSPDIQPASTTGPSFGEMSFCLKNDFNETARRCETSRMMLTGQVERVYVSWTYSNVYVGMQFSRKWYRNNQLILLPEAENDVWDGYNWKTDGVSEYTWLDAMVFEQEYFPPGSYMVELYIGDRLEQVGHFTIE